MFIQNNSLLSTKYLKFKTKAVTNKKKAALFFPSLTIMSYLLTGCMENQENTNESELEDSTQIKKNIKIEEQLSSKYAHRAAGHKHACPKLLQTKIDNSLIIRNAEKLRGEYCDYYIYPTLGQVLSISPDEDNSLEVTLRMPTMYDFANGNFVVTENRRHVIRVAYAGSQRKPNDYVYNINFDLK